MRWCLARLFSAYRLLESQLERERAEHEKELARVNAERERERSGRQREWDRANAAEKLLHQREEEFFFKLSGLARLPASPEEVARLAHARSQITGNGKTPTMGVHTLSQIRRKQEEESLRKANRDRENAPPTDQEARIAEEAERFRREEHIGG